MEGRVLQLAMGVHPYNPRQEDYCKLKASLVYMENTSLSRITQFDPASECFFLFSLLCRTFTIFSLNCVQSLWGYTVSLGAILGHRIILYLSFDIMFSYFYSGCTILHSHKKCATSLPTSSTMPLFFKKFYLLTLSVWMCLHVCLPGYGCMKVRGQH